MTAKNTEAATIWEGLRRLYNCNKSQLAERLGVDRRTLNRWENGLASDEGRRIAKEALSEAFAHLSKQAENRAYVIKDMQSGLIWGQTFAANPLQACKIVDEETRNYGRTYQTGSDPAGGSPVDRCYAVFECPQGYTIEDIETDLETETPDQIQLAEFVYWNRAD